MAAKNEDIRGVQKARPGCTWTYKQKNIEAGMREVSSILLSVRRSHHGFYYMVFSRPDIVDFESLGGPERPVNSPKKSVASPPNFFEWFPGRPGPAGNPKSTMRGRSKNHALTNSGVASQAQFAPARCETDDWAPEGSLRPLWDGYLCLFEKTHHHFFNSRTQLLD